MHRLVCFRYGLLLRLIGVFATGCGGTAAPSSAVVQQRPLQEVGQLYRQYEADRQKPPTNIADLKPYQQMAPEGFLAVANGSVVVVWEVKLTDLADEGSKDSSEEVLAYEKKVPTEGGDVLMKNRTIKHMTADQFKAAPKAAGSS